MARVLVVDDDPVLNQMVQANMRLAGHEVFSALSGQAALRDLESINPELVILDVMMPGMTGFEVCRRMRETTTVPVLFLTARGEEEDLVQGFDSGGDDYMRKPFSQREPTTICASHSRSASWKCASALCCSVRSAPTSSTKLKFISMINCRSTLRSRR